MKLWQKNTIQTDALIEQFTVGNDRILDLQLAKYDVEGSLAHIKMLATVGLLTTDELAQLETELHLIYQDILAEKFEIEPQIEDVHSQIELLLTRKLGDIGKKIHSARSRNDQVLLDVRLFYRAELSEIIIETKQLFDVLLDLSEKNKAVLLPGYTHLQVAMMSSFGLWFGAYAENLVDDMQLLQATYRIVNQNPLGSAAGYGSSLPINRQLTTELLGFDAMNYNVVHAQMGRGKIEHFLSFAFAALGHTFSRMSMDICLYMSQNFAFLTLPNHLSTGSSIMPHKKNPDVFELLRAKGNRLQALPNEIALLTSNLPSGYHRDYQLLKEIIFPAIANLKECLVILQEFLPQIIVNQDILNDEKYKYIYSVEEVNRLVTEGVPFREAYQIVGNAIENNVFFPEKNIQHTHEGSIGNLCTAEIRRKMERILETS